MVTAHCCIRCHPPSIILYIAIVQPENTVATNVKLKHFALKSCFSRNNCLNKWSFRRQRLNQQRRRRYCVMALIARNTAPAPAFSRQNQSQQRQIIVAPFSIGPCIAHQKDLNRGGRSRSDRLLSTRKIFISPERSIGADKRCCQRRFLFYVTMCRYNIDTQQDRATPPSIHAPVVLQYK